MGEYMNFQGKQVDDAIASACRQFKCTREELEVEILSGGSSGIFGLVGVKKAKIKARLREPVTTSSMTPPKAEEKRSQPASQRPPQQEKKDSRPKQESKPQNRPQPKQDDPKTTSDNRSPKPETQSKPDARKKSAPRPKAAAAKNPRPKQQNGQGKQAPKKNNGSALSTHSAAPQKPVDRNGGEKLQTPEAKDSAPTPINFSPEEAKELILKSLRVLLTNISEGTAITVDMEATPIEVVIDDEENSGLIIGRDGQTISSLQYLLNRIVSRKYPGIARIQLDAGNYREKQDEQLRKTALFLAQKAQAGRRTQSTRPLSSYHRRVVHMALQEDKDIQTRSKGDGPMKRVLIIPRRKKNTGSPNGQRKNGAANGSSQPIEQTAPVEES